MTWTQQEIEAERERQAQCYRELYPGRTSIPASITNWMPTLNVLARTEGERLQRELEDEAGTYKFGDTLPRGFVLVKALEHHEDIEPTLIPVRCADKDFPDNSNSCSKEDSCCGSYMGDIVRGGHRLVRCSQAR